MHGVGRPPGSGSATYSPYEGKRRLPLVRRTLNAAGVPAKMRHGIPRCRRTRRIACSDSTPEMAMNDSIMARIKYRRLLPVLVAASPTTKVALMSHHPSRVGRMVRGSQ